MNSPIARNVDDPEKGSPGYQAVTVYQPSHAQDVQGDPRNVRRRPFWHFLICTSLFVITLHTFLGTKTTSEIGHFAHDEYKTGPSKCEDVVNWTKSTLNRAHEYPFHAQTSITLPLLDLFFISEGSLQHGDFEVSQDLENHSDNAVVDIYVSYKVPDALDEATVCRVHPEADEWGVGIFTPFIGHPHRERHLKFHVHLRLPAAKSGDNVLKINSLSVSKWTDASSGNWWTKRGRSVVRLHSTNTPIDANFVAGNSMRFEASNAAISGTFNASTSLVIETINAPIDVKVNLLNDNLTFTTLAMITTNARIDGSISLTSNANASNATAGKFRTSACATNGPLHLEFTDAPLNSTLILDANTTLAPAELWLHRTFEGHFDLESSEWFTPDVDYHTVEDPAKRNRTRRVPYTQVGKGHVRGDVVWDKEWKNRSLAILKSSRAPVHLFLY